jgi:Ca2+-binding EF-hand superfamily protein
MDKHTRGDRWFKRKRMDEKAVTLQSMPKRGCIMYRDVAEALQSIQQGPSDTKISKLQTTGETK